MTRPSCIYSLLLTITCIFLTGCDQRRPEYTIGVIQWTEQVTPYVATYNGITDSLHEKGYIEGVNLEVEYVNVEQDKVKAHHAAIDFSAKNVDVTSERDEGTTFSLFFPVTDNNVTPGKTAFDIRKFMGTGKSVLIVDDSDTQREIARSIFQKLDYTPFTAASGEEAVSFLECMEVDLVLLDMVMEPGMDGLDTFLQIIEFKPDQKLIITSGFSENDRVKQIQTLSGCSYLAKPYTIEGISKTAFAELHKT